MREPYSDEGLRDYHIAFKEGGRIIVCGERNKLGYFKPFHKKMAIAPSILIMVFDLFHRDSRAKIFKDGRFLNDSVRWPAFSRYIAPSLREPICNVL